MAEAGATRAALIVAVEQAFDGVPPGSITLHEAEVIDAYGSEVERMKARARDPEKRWTDVPETSLLACRNALPHLDPTGWRFYLPALIRFALRVWGTPKSPVDRVIYALAYGDDREVNDYLRRRFYALDAAQTEVVKRFLELACDNACHCDAVVARRALEQYWRRAASK